MLNAENQKNRKAWRISIHEAIVFLVLFGRMNGDMAGNDYIFVALLFLAALGIVLLSKLKKHTFEFLAWQGSFYALIVLSTLWSVSRETTIRYLLATFARCFLIVYISFYMRDINAAVKASKIFIISNFINQLYLIIIKGFSFIVSYRETTFNDGSWNTNVVAATAAFSLFLIYFLDQTAPNKEKSRRALTIIYVIFDLLMCVLCGSKVAMFSVLLLLGGYYIFIHKRNRFLLFILIVLSIPLLYLLIIKIPFLYNVIGSRIESLLLGMFGIKELTVSDFTRRNLIELGWTWFKESPWIGHGMSTFSYLYVLHGGYRALYAHNNYIEILVGLGIIGLLVYYFEYFKILWKARKIKDINSRGFVIVLIISYLILDYASVSYMVEVKLFVMAFAIFLVSEKSNHFPEDA